MSAALGIIDLTRDSVRFVLDNLRVLKDHLIVIFPLLMVLQVIVLTGDALHKGWVGLLALIPCIYLYACYALSWHRSALRGADAAHAVNPFGIKEEDKRFIAWFFAFFLIPFVVGAGVGFLIGLAAQSGWQWLAAISGIAVVAGFFVVAIMMVRLSFILPALSLKADATLREAYKTSKGLVLKVIAAAFLVGMVFLAVFFLYGLIVALSVGVITQDMIIGVPMTVFITFLFGLPVQIAMMLATAINITILSRAYQWGQQNNPAG